MSSTMTHVATYLGPNPHAMAPVVVVNMFFEAELLARASAVLPDFVALLPHPMPATEPAQGGPATALDIAQSLARWALAALNHVRGYLHDAGATALGNPHHCQIWLGFHQQWISLGALRLSLRLLQHLVREGKPPSNWSQQLAAFWGACRQHHPDYQARMVMEAARASGVPWLPAWGQARHWQYGHGARSRVLFESSSADDGWLGARVAHSKVSSKQALISLGLPTPVHRLANTPEDLAAAAGAVGYPCVTKPIDQGGGRGVSVGLGHLEELDAGFRLARQLSAGPVMVERCVMGDDHRLMVVDGRLQAVVRRDPPRVIGDGRQTIRALVDRLNATRDPNSLIASGYLRHIAWDEACLGFLAAQGWSPASVPSEGTVVTLRGNANLSTGGTCTDVTDRTHPQVRQAAEALAATLCVGMLGIDYIAADIGLPLAEAGGAFIEVNLTPSLDVLVAAGWSSQSAGALALGEHPARVPVDLVLLPDEAVPAAETALARMPLPVGTGWASARGAMLGALPLVVSSASVWASSRALLSHRLLDRAVVLMAMGDLQRSGLPVDRFQTAHVLGVLLEPWAAVLARSCASVRTASALSDVLAELLAPAGAEG